MIQGLGLRCPDCGEAVEIANGLCTCTGCNLATAAHPVLDLCPELDVEGFSAARRHHLQGLLENRHFWFAPRQTLCETLLDRFGAASVDTAIELGCGMGSFLPSLIARAERVVAVDGYAASLEEAADIAPAALCLKADVCQVPMDSGQFELVVALDVAEHLNDQQFFAEAARLAKPGACLLMTVPACPALWSDLDEIAGHRRRYQKHGLVELLRETGWRSVYLTHYQFLLFPLVWLVRRWPTDGLRRYERNPRPGAGGVLGAISRFEVKILNRWRLPWGSSLVVVARLAA